MLDNKAERSEQLRTAVASRLERVRGNLTDAQFDQLVADVVSTTQRFDEIEARARHNPTPPPRAVPALERLASE